MDETITSRISHDDIEILDRLIKMGRFKNRSEAIRTILSKGLRETIKGHLYSDIQEELEKKPVLTDQELLEYGKKLFPKSVAEVVAEGRER
ncbi:MAG: ribbon-helix-helix domain-containing protein [Candidatus Hodarchaeales archaeon]